MEGQKQKISRLIPIGFFILFFGLLFLFPQETHAYVSNGMRIHLESNTEEVALGGKVDATLVINADADLDSVKVTFSSTDNITINGETLMLLGSAESGGTITLPVSFTVNNEGKGTFVA